MGVRVACVSSVRDSRVVVLGPTTNWGSDEYDPSTLPDLPNHPLLTPNHSVGPELSTDQAAHRHKYSPRSPHPGRAPSGLLPAERVWALHCGGSRVKSASSCRSFSTAYLGKGADVAYPSHVVRGPCAGMVHRAGRSSRVNVIPLG